MQILELNLDVLLRIFNLLDEKDLQNLCCAHPVFRDVIDENIFYRQTLDSLMSGHRNRPSIMERTQDSLSFMERVFLERNWLSGRYRERQFFYHTQMFPTKLHLERDYIYMTYACYLRQYKRLDEEAIARRCYMELTTNTKADIADFVKKGDTLFVGRVNGSCFISENGYITEQSLHSPREYLYCVEFANDMYATSTDRSAKLWRRSDEFGLVHLDQQADLRQSYKVLKFNQSGDRLFGGLYTDVSRRALREVNIETGAQSILMSNTISIYDLKLKDENIIFTANFDTTFRMFDRRTNRDEMIWEDPFDSSFYCLDYDGLYGVLCGTKYHSRINLYDIRVPGKYMQLYFPYRLRRGGSSPVYSLACDSRYLFVATDHNLRVFDFKANYEPSRDYRYVFTQMQRV